MIYFNNTTEFSISRKTAVTLGKFDGIHMGHQKLIREIRSCEKDGMLSVVFALDVNTDKHILTEEERCETIRDLGLGGYICCPFVPEISGMEPEEFARKILTERLHAAHVTVGCDFRFGKKRSGDAQMLLEIGKRLGFTVSILEKEKYNGREISSTYIREELEKGNIPEVNILMGRRFPVSGTIVHGRHLGTGMGMPTVNIIPQENKLLPPNGVYLTVSRLEGYEGNLLEGITNIGRKPTVDGTFLGAETYLYDLNTDLYGRRIQTELLKFMRPEQKFESVEKLKEIIHKDIAAGRSCFCEQGLMEHKPVSAGFRSDPDRGGTGSGSV